MEETAADSKDEGGTTTASTQEDAAAAMPLPYAFDADGRKQPLPGSRSIFLRGGTVEAFGLAGLSSKSGNLMAAVPKDKLLADMQFQGAISDFHPIKDAIKATDYDELLLRVNDDDIFGDGNNFEVAVTKAAAETWQAIQAAQQQAAAAATAAAEAAAAEAALPRSKCRRERRPWVDHGTEVELEQLGIFSSTSSSTASAAAREPAALLLSRPRRAFGAPLVLVDAPASDLWASSTMEARPFKDANYDLRRMQLETAVQAVPSLQEATVQATGGRPRPGSTQTQPRQLQPDQVEQLLRSQGFNAFLDMVRPRLDEALLQNSIADVLADDLNLLNDEEGEGLGADASSSSSKSAAAGGGAGGRPEHGGLTEAQNFTDLTYSKNKVVSSICWLPHRKGVVACSCTDPASQTERLASMGRLSAAYILIWNFRDPIHPEYVLESPHEVFCFQYNPSHPDLVIGGCYNGQVVVWDTAGVELAGQAGQWSGDKGSAGSWEDSAGEEEATPIVRHKYLSSIEFSHTSVVSDITWLPGIEIDKAGRVSVIRAESAGPAGPQALFASLNGAAASKTAGAAVVPTGVGTAKECCSFASIAGDGKVMFWDVRVDKLLKKGNKRMDDGDLLWKPIHVVHLLSMAGNDFAGCRFSFDPLRFDTGNFTAGSMDGELLTGNFIRPPGEDNPDYTHCVFAPHAGPLVALAASPFLHDVLLSVGDWTFRLWQGVESRTPMFTSPYADEAYTAAAWSPSRPGLLFLATAAGSLHIWDLLDRSHEPSLRINAASSAITSISFSIASSSSSSSHWHMKHASVQPSHAAQPAVTNSEHQQLSNDPADAAAVPQSMTGGSNQQQQQQQHQQHGAGLQVLAVGDASGVLHLFELPRTLRRPLPNERKLMAGFVAREAARVADIAARQPLRVAALKQLEEAKKEDSAPLPVQYAPGAADAANNPSKPSSTNIHSSHFCIQAGPASATAAILSACETAALDNAEKQYRELENEFKVQLGLA